MKEIKSNQELQDILTHDKKTYLLLWKRGSDQSDCAFRGLKKATEKFPELTILAADVSIVRDIHPAYGITSVPILLLFTGKTLKNVYKGCHDEGYFSSILEEAAFQAKIQASGKPSKNVIVYTTPTCSWCNTLKQWLRKNLVAYSEIDVSMDETAARELVRRSGQQGVPQTEINGQIVVGFDQARLKQLLEL